VTEKQQPIFHPLSMIATISAIVKGMLEASEEQFKNMTTVIDRSHVLDDEIINRSVNLYNEQNPLKYLKSKKFLRLVMKLIETPIIENGTIVTNKEGCCQGLIVSPVLVNVFLHYVIDSWFAKISKENLMGQTGMVRYCDDMVFVFLKG
jgi:hypothetical protein